MLTYERAKEVVRYEPQTGEFVWAITRHNRAIAGRRAGCTRKDGYRLIRIDDKLYLGHRVAWLLMTGGWPDKEVDHIDGNPGNNVWKNLRLSTHSQNITNQKVHKDCATGHKGIRAHPNGRFYVVVDKKSRGGYPTLDEAKAVYERIAKEIYGEFHRT